MSTGVGVAVPLGLKNLFVTLFARSTDRPIAYLNVLRGLAILMVIAAHFNISPSHTIKKFPSPLAIAAQSYFLLIRLFDGPNRDETAARRVAVVARFAFCRCTGYQF